MLLVAAVVDCGRVCSDLWVWHVGVVTATAARTGHCPLSEVSLRELSVSKMKVIVHSG